jgi:hypothetical protein
MISMDMQPKVFMARVENVTAAEAEVNTFLRGHRVLAVKREFAADGENLFPMAQRQEHDGTQKQILINWPRPAERRHELTISLNQKSLL